jgi:hypothetical protein
MKAKPAGFTRIELMALVAAIALMIALALPLVASTSTSAARLSCFNNLRQLGTAVLLFSNNHNERPPWLTPVAEGGTYPAAAASKYAAPWTELIVLSNDLASPRVLACPSDSSSQVASHWGGTSGGLANSGMRANAVSYFLSFHGQIEQGHTLVSGDRDFTPSQFPPSACSRRVLNTATLIQGDTNIRWTNAVHRNSGHLLFMDGTVEYVDSAGFRASAIIGEPQDNQLSTHFVNSR